MESRATLQPYCKRILGLVLLGAVAMCDRAPAPTESPVVPGPAVTTAALTAGGISHVLLTAGNNPSNLKSYTTAVIAPAANALVTVAVMGHGSSSAPASPVVTGGGMAAWTEVASVGFDAVGSPHKRLTIFRAMSATPGSGALTIKFSGAVSNCQWIVSQWSGVDPTGVNGSGAIGQIGTNRGDAVSGLAVSLTPFANASNVAYGVFGVRRNVVAITPGSGFTEIDERPSAENTPADLEAEWTTSVNAIAASWAALNGGGLGVEIKAATAGPIVSPTLSTVTASPTSIVANGATATISVTVKDAGGIPISGATVALTAAPTTGNTLVQPATPTDANGVTTGTFSSTAVEAKTISASANGTPITQTATVTVTAVPVAAVVVAPAAASVPVWGTVQLNAVTLDADGNPLSGRTVTWGSSNASVAAVSTGGLVTGLAGGSATVTATSEGKSGSSTITVTPPPPGSPVVLVGAGDIADCSASGDEATATLLDNITGVVFATGDNAYPDGSATDYIQCYDPSWGRHKARTRPAPGNHDYHISGAADYFAYFGAQAGTAAVGYYSYDLGEWHIISLNSNISMSAGSAQEQWLRADLAASTRQCTIAYWHHPRFSSGTQHGSSASAQPLWQALYEAGAEIVVSSHEHNYERFALQAPDGSADAVTGIREFVSGTGGASHYDDLLTPLPNSVVFNGTTWGVLKLSLGSGTYSWEFIPVVGATFTDAGTGVCHGRPVSGSQSSVSGVPPAIATSTGSIVSTITVTARDATGAAVPGVSVVLSATGSENLISQPTGPTDANGQATGTLSSNVPETKTITATANGVAITQTASVIVTLTPVASVDVTPALATVSAGASVQLTATPKDANGNPLTDRVVTWSESNGTIAAVNRNGLMLGVGSGTSSVSATSEGQSGSAGITVTAPTPCLARSGPLLTLSGLRTTQYSNTSLAGNTTIDASSAQFLTGTHNPVVLGNGSGVCFHGGEIIGQLPPSTDWNTMHDTYAFQVTDMPSFMLDATRVFDYGDGITLKNATTTWIIQNVHFQYMRDDCVQDDWLNSGIIDSSFFEGCSTGLSARPFVPTADGSDNLVVVKNSLFWLQDMDQGYDGPGHGGFFKWSPTGPMVSLYNNVYRVDSPSSLGTHSLGPPAGKLHDCANNVMVWLGSGPFPEPLPSCYTVLTGAAGLAFWNNAVAAWKTKHPDALTDVGPPIVSLFAPASSATFTGPVTLTATAVDDRGIVGVLFRMNGQDIGPEVAAESPASKFTLVWDSRGLPDGSYTLNAVARDAAGHSTTAAGIAVSINNGVSPTLSAVAVSSASLVAGSGVALITVTVKDNAGNPVPGASVVLSATGSGNTVTQPVGLTDANGQAPGSLSSTSAGSKTVLAVAGGVTIVQQPVVTVSAGPPDPGVSTLSANPLSITAGNAPATITTTVRDQFGNPVSGVTVVLSATGTGNALTQPTLPTNASGVATGTLGSTVAGDKVVAATANGVAITQTATVTVAAPLASAVTHTLLTSGHDVINQRVYITAPIAPAPNALVTVAVLSHRSYGAISATISGGGMPSWEQVASVDFDTLGFPLRRMTIFRAMSATPGSGAITITFSGNVSNCQWIVSQWDGVETGGVNGAGAIVQTGSNRADVVNGLAVTLGTFGNANNVAYGVFGVNKNVPAITPGAGFTKIDEQSSGESTPGDLLAEWMTNSNVITATWTNLRGGALGVELKAKVGP